MFFLKTSTSIMDCSGFIKNRCIDVNNQINIFPYLELKLLNIILFSKVKICLDKLYAINLISF